jgi:transposase
MKQLDYNLLFSWFVDLSIDAKVWDYSVFSKNQERFLGSDLAGGFFGRIKAQAAQAGLLSDEHFTVDGILIEAWAPLKSCRPSAPPLR